MFTNISSQTCIWLSYYLSLSLSWLPLLLHHFKWPYMPFNRYFDLGLMMTIPIHEIGSMRIDTWVFLKVFYFWICDTKTLIPYMPFNRYFDLGLSLLMMTIPILEISSMRIDTWVFFKVFYFWIHDTKTLIPCVWSCSACRGRICLPQDELAQAGLSDDDTVHEKVTG